MLNRASKAKATLSAACPFSDILKCGSESRFAQCVCVCVCVRVRGWCNLGVVTRASMETTLLSCC